MKKTFIFLITSLFILTSFYYADQTVSTMKEQDPLLIKIKEEASRYYVEPVDAYIDAVWGIIPGLAGREVDVDLSYSKMKKENVFDSKKLVFKSIEPKTTIWDLKDQPIFLGNATKGMVTLMINVAWGEEFIPDMLNVLDENKVKASFFVDGKWLEKNKELGLEIYLRGHDLLNHGFLHHDVTTMTYDQIKKELKYTNDLIYNLTMHKPEFFTPPSGAYNATAIKVCEDLNMKLVMFSADTIDWKKPTKEVIISRAIKRTEPGKLLLMHPTKNTSEALDTMIKMLQKKGLKIEKMTNHLSTKR